MGLEVLLNGNQDSALVSEVPKSWRCKEPSGSTVVQSFAVAILDHEIVERLIESTTVIGTGQKGWQNMIPNSNGVLRILRGVTLTRESMATPPEGPNFVSK
jgi:hypothetical protein